MLRRCGGCLQGIYAPEMLLERTTPRVLIMEWVEGQRLRRAGRNGEGPSRAELQADLKLVEIGVQCSLEQACILPYQTWCSAAPPMAHLLSEAAWLPVSGNLIGMESAQEGLVNMLYMPTAAYAKY